MGLTSSRPAKECLSSGKAKAFVKKAHLIILCLPRITSLLLNSRDLNYIYKISVLCCIKLYNCGVMSQHFVIFCSLESSQRFARPQGERTMQGMTARAGGGIWGGNHWSWWLRELGSWSLLIGWQQGGGRWSLPLVLMSALVSLCLILQGCGRRVRSGAETRLRA